MKTRFLIIIGFIVALVSLGTFSYAMNIQNQCESLPEYLHNPRLGDWWGCYEYLKIIENPPEIEPSTSSFMDKITPTIDDFKNTLSEPYDIDTIFFKFGKPHDDIGSGIHIYVYELNDSTQVWVGYTDRILYVRHIDSDGNLLEQLFSENPNYGVPITPQIGKNGTYKLDSYGKTFDVKYSIKGAMIQEIIYSNNSNSLVIAIDVTHEGHLEVAIPRNLVDAKLDYCPPRHENSPDDLFFVLLDGEEINYDEISTTVESRTLQIPFNIKTEKIEVIGTCFV